ncbi:hypothetical protein OA512_04290 [SAR86 cluster bacterium]|nr:hypothetical protein [SAR86 cluster bacterium]
MVARIIIESALARDESRGLHFNSDHPNLKDKAVPSIISKNTIKDF